MCARYTQIRDLQAILALVQCRGGLPAWMPRYNIAPQQPAPVIVRTQEATELKLMRWGLVPSWAEDAKIGAQLINARAETLRQKPSFREAFARRRCLVLADGFYEWETTPAGKRPWRFVLRDEAPFCFAGLWAVWQPRPAAQTELFSTDTPPAGPLETFTIITTTANDLVRPIHDRMPVILTGEALRLWLNPASPPQELQKLLQPFPADAMLRLPASRRVNRPGAEGPECLEPE
ncbi:SOS response-associated peptidase [Fontisphaera persica]|uniref:SOS response-associated peptidase n=1 Tax=Fontisphaera persica TaxID=2974023 RepID=UPI0024BFA43C|nr:SOS response-associated peptidase [Fontisphaera persica]WCJ60587.1 SOS response-associated peptidase [Fontisphaera persica]